MLFYNSIHLRLNEDVYISEKSDYEIPSSLKRQKPNIDGRFNLIDFDEVFGSFLFKEYLIEPSDSFVEVNACINDEFKKLFIDLSDHPSLLNRIRLLPIEERSQQINYYVLNFLGIDVEIAKNKSLFDSLGIIDKEDKKIVMSIKGDDVAKLPYIFDKIFLGDDIKQKIESYEQKKILLRSDLKSLDILNKIFVNGLAIKIFKNEVSIVEVLSYDFIEFEIADKARTEINNQINFSIKNNYKSLVNFFASISLNNLEFAIVSAAFYGKKELFENLFLINSTISSRALRNSIIYASRNGHKEIVVFILAQDYSLLKLAITNTIIGGQKELLENFFFNDIIISEEDLKNAVICAVQNEHKNIVLFLISKNIDLLDLAFSSAALHGKLNILKQLFTYKVPILFENVEKYILIAFANGYESIVLEFLSRAPEHVSLVFYNAVIFNNKKLIRNISLNYRDDLPEEDLKNAIKWSVKSKNNGTLNYLISLFPKNLGLAVVDSASDGELELLENIFSTYREIPEESLKSAVVNSARNGHINVVNYFLSKDKENLALAVFGASLGGKLEIIKSILIDAVSIPSEDLKKCILTALEKEHEPIILELLLKAPEHLKMVFYNIINSNKEEIFKNLLFNYKNILDEDLRDIISFVSQNGNKSMVCSLLTKFPETLGSVVIILILYEKTELVETIVPAELILLLKNLKTIITKKNKFDYEIIINYLVSKNPINLKSAILASISCNREDLVRNILTGVTDISFEDMEKYILTAIEKEYKSIVLELLLKSPEHVRMAFCKAVIFNKKELVKSILLKYRNIPAQDLNNAIKWSIKFKNKDVLYLLLSEFPENLGFAFITAAFNGELKLLENIELKYKEIPKEALKSAIVNAARNGHINVINYLLLKDQQNLSSAVFGASLGGKLEIIKSLLPDGVNIPSEDLQRCILIALKNEHESIILELLTKAPEYLKMVFYDSISHNKEELFKNLLFNYSFVLNENLKDVIRLVVLNGNEHIIKSLLIKFPETFGSIVVDLILCKKERLAESLISTELMFLLKDLKKFVTQLNKNDYEIIINYFFSKNPVLLEGAILASVSCGREDLVRNIFSSGKTISKQGLKQAIEFATCNGYESILNYLLSENYEENALSKNLLWNSP